VKPLDQGIINKLIYSWLPFLYRQAICAAVTADCDCGRRGSAFGPFCGVIFINETKAKEDIYSMHERLRLLYKIFILFKWSFHIKLGSFKVLY
jgi:hypothetical protein